MLLKSVNSEFLNAGFIHSGTTGTPFACWERCPGIGLASGSDQLPGVCPFGERESYLPSFTEGGNKMVLESLQAG